MTDKGMFEKVLIANRGEIALRIQRACKKLGIQTVAVYSEADRDALHVREAGERVCIGPRSAKDSYLNQVAVLSAARITGADAIHPGYGFLSENATFASLCRDFKIAFIGPSPESIELLGDKTSALTLARTLGLPLLSPFDDTADSFAVAAGRAQEIGYPVILKAAAGGGGRGMKICRSREDLERFYPLARAEARAAFSDDRVFVEKYLTEPRHIEFQIVADRYGNAAYLPERECSLQRRHQKMLEESPSLAVSEELREKMGADAVRLAKAGNYCTVGTVEFLLGPDGRYYFIEMNTRIQVEHPVTEMVAGIDLVKLQIRLAAGAELPFSQKQVRIRGHAVEFRVNAEDPFKGVPSPGTVSHCVFPDVEGVRIESALFSGCEVSANYDPMVAKVIVGGKTRKEVMRKAIALLRDTKILGIETNIPLHLKILAAGDFRDAKMHTGTIEKILANTRGIGTRIPGDRRPVEIVPKVA